MQKIILFFTAVTLFTLTAVAQNTKGVVKNVVPENQVKHKVVIQLSSNDTLVWKGLMNNLKHLKFGWGDSVQIEVVAHGFGIEMLMTAKTTQQKKIAEFKNMGIVFVACENTLREKNISKELIIHEVDFVPMGIGEIVKKQEQGWSYIKAGF
jgi:uncharacterized protein